MKKFIEIKTGLYVLKTCVTSIQKISTDGILLIVDHGKFVQELNLTFEKEEIREEYLKALLQSLNE